MSDLQLHGKKVENVFQLLGSLENDMSRSVAWALDQCPQLMKEFVRSTLEVKIDPEQTTIKLQVNRVHKGAMGITDVEIECPGSVHIIIEAKKGIEFPSDKQLSMYAKRLRPNAHTHRCLIALTDSPPDFADAHFPIRKLGGVPVHHLSWSEILELAARARSKSKLKEKYLLNDLIQYLKGVATMQETDSNRVYVVALSIDRPASWGVSWIEVVTKKRRYFHPVGRGWPIMPPNYIAFRYKGELQSIHHIEGYDVVDDINEAIKEIPKGEIRGRFFVYLLGKPFRPDHRVPSGIKRAARRWCMLDTLFTSDSIADASALSNKRKLAAGDD